MGGFYFNWFRSNFVSNLNLNYVNIPRIHQRPDSFSY
jgi:hypothetical protein